MTKLKQDILNLIQTSKGHVSAEEIFFMAKEVNISISMASTYRILGELADKGLIRRIKVTGEKDIFDKTLIDHGHMVCIKCGKISDVNIPNFKKIIIKETGIKDFDSYDLCINYICDDCKKG